MARYRVLGWREIPSLVEARDVEERVQVVLSQRFQDLIDSIAMRDGATEGEAYLEGWAHGPEAELPGGAREVAERVAADLEQAFPSLVGRLMRPA
jgi:Virulence factor